MGSWSYSVILPYLYRGYFTPFITIVGGPRPTLRSSGLRIPLLRRKVPTPRIRIWNFQFGSPKGFFPHLLRSVTLPETNIFGPENEWLEDYLPFGARPSFRANC